MRQPEEDTRDERRIRSDEAIAVEGPMTPPDLSEDEHPIPMEELLMSAGPVARLGVVEGGVVRFVDGGSALPERTRVVVVAAGPVRKGA